MMRNERFSGLDELKANDALKQQIIKNIKNDTDEPVKRKMRATRWIALAASFVLVVGVACVYWPKLIDDFTKDSYNLQGQNTGVSGQSDKFEILENPPENLPIGIFADYQPLIEEQVFAFADIITYGQVVDLKWVKTDMDYYIDYLSYRTIVTVKVINQYKGDIKSEEEVEILLPVAISGESNQWIEDNNIVTKLSVGSKAFFFAKESGPEDYLESQKMGVLKKDVCKYSIQWGEEFVILQKGRDYIHSYMFKSLRRPGSEFEPSESKSSFSDVENMIKKYVE